MRRPGGIGPILAAAVLGAVVLGPGWRARADDARPAGFTQVQADNGEDLYRDRCVTCHGAHLNDGEFAPPLKGARFRDKWGARSVGELFAYASGNMPPGQVGVLTPDDYADILAFLLQANGAKAGDKPLPADAEKLSAQTWPAP